MALDPALISIAQQLAEGLQKSRTVNYAHLAGFIIVYFDWFLTLDSEITLIWNGEGVKMKILYSLTRYLPLVYFPLFLHYRFSSGYPEAECTALYRAFGTMFTIAAICAALVVTIRTWAVWGKAKHITYMLFGTYALASAFILVFFIISLKYTSHPVFNFSGLPPLGCNPKFESPYLPAAFVVEAVYDTANLLLMLIRGISLFRSGRDSSLFRSIYNDGILFYAYISFISITNFGLLFGRGHYESFLLMFQGGARSVLACRIVLRIRMRYHKLQAKTQRKIGSSYVGVHVKKDVVASPDV